MGTHSKFQHRCAYRAGIALGALMIVSGCATGDRESRAAASSCDASAAQWAVGQTISDSLANRIQLDSRSTLVRRVRPGQPVTLDVRPDRLNIKLDDNGKIESISCG